MRLCKVCAKPASERDAYLLCDEHLREYRRKYNQRRGKNLAKQARLRYAADPGRYRAASRAWEKKNAVRMHLVHGAGGYVRWAVAIGLLKKPRWCERCHRGNCLIEAAHADYSKPLEVEWLCRSCHRLWDRSEPKTMPRLGMVVYEGDPEPSPDGEDDDGQEPGLEGGTKDGDGPSLD